MSAIVKGKGMSCSSNSTVIDYKPEKKRENEIVKWHKEMCEFQKKKKKKNGGVK